MARVAGMKINSQRENHQNPIEQQTVGTATQEDQSLWVINPFLVRGPDGLPTGPLWDADDIYSFGAGGYLNPGETFEVKKDIVADWRSHSVGLRGTGDLRSNFEISIKVDNPTFAIVAQPNVVIGKSKVARLFLEGPAYRRTDTLPSIPNSNGGVGVYPTIYTVSITNNSAKRASFTLQSFMHYGNFQGDLYTSAPSPVTSYEIMGLFNPSIYYTIN